MMLSAGETRPVNVTGRPFTDYSIRRGSSVANVSIASRTLGNMTGDRGQTACVSNVTEGTDVRT